MNETGAADTAHIRRILLINVGILACVLAFVFARGASHIGWLEQHMNDQQKQFAAITKKYRNSYSAANDLEKPAYQPQRADAICNLFNGNLQVADWFGYVRETSRMSDGQAGLAVWLPTENNMPAETLLSGEKIL